MNTNSFRAITGKTVLGYGSRNRTLRIALGTLALLFTLVLLGNPGHASGQSLSVWLYGPQGAYCVAGYTIGGGHISDPLGDQIGIVIDDSIYDNQNNLIGFVAVGA